MTLSVPVKGEWFVPGHDWKFWAFDQFSCVRNAVGHSRFVINALGKGSNVSIVFRLGVQIPGSEHLRVLINRPLPGRGARSTTLSLRVGLQKTKGFVDCLELGLGIEVLGAVLSPRVTNHLRMKKRARRRLTGVMLTRSDHGCGPLIILF